MDWDNAKWDLTWIEVMQSDFTWSESRQWDSTLAESMYSETPYGLSQNGVRLHTDWVNAEWDCTWTEPMQTEIPQGLSQSVPRLTWTSQWGIKLHTANTVAPHRLNQYRVRYHIGWVNADKTPHGLSQFRVRLNMDQVNAEWDLTWTGPMQSETAQLLSLCSVRLYMN
jgi:hypothetical protein